MVYRNLKSGGIVPTTGDYPQYAREAEVKSKRRSADVKGTSELLANKTEDEQIAVLSLMQASEGGLTECQDAALKSKRRSADVKATSELLANNTEAK